MSNSVRLACAFGAIVVATFALGPATAGSGTLRLADADSRAVICKPAPDGSRTCTYETGGGAGGDLGQGSAYQACRGGCGERASRLPTLRQSRYLAKCIPGCDRYRQHVHG
jgi:hypothetical protein